MSVRESVHQAGKFHESVENLVLYACGFGFGTSEVCVVGDVEIAKEDDSPLLEVAGGDEVYEFIPFCEGSRG